MTTLVQKVLVLLILIFPLTTNAQDWNEVYKLLASDHQKDAQLGYAVDIDGSTAVVGANGKGTGFAYVFEKQADGTWKETHILKPSDGKAQDQFGSSVSVKGNTIVVGASWCDIKNGENTFQDAGAAYIFERKGNEWKELQKIRAFDPFTEDQFGISVDVDGNHILVGSIWNDTDTEGKKRRMDAGAVYAFEKANEKWLYKQKIVPKGRKAFDLFGISVSIEGNNAIIGAYRNGFDQDDKKYIEFAGTAYYFKRSSEGIWEETQKLVAKNRAAGAFFGYSVSLAGNIVVIGAQEDKLDINNGSELFGSGSAHIFELNNNTWSEKQKITALDRQKTAFFGESVYTDGKSVIVGAWGQNTDGDGQNVQDTAGAAYIFQKDGEKWIQTKKVVSVDRKMGDQLGISVAIDGNYSISGAWGQDENANGDKMHWSGSAYIFGFCDIPNLSYSASQEFIVEGDDVILGASGADNIKWNNGVKNNISFRPEKSLSYEVIGRNKDGCYAKGQLVVTVKPKSVEGLALKPIQRDEPIAAAPKNDFRIIQLDNNRALAASTQEIIQKFSGLTVLSNLKYDGTDEPAANVNVLLLDENGVILKRGVTDAKGIAKFDLLDPDRTYNVVIDKNDPQLEAVVMKEGQELSLKENKFIENVGGYALLSHIEFKESSEPAPEVYVLLLDENGYILKKGKTDRRGMATFEALDKEKSYQVVIDKNHPTLNVDVSLNGRLVAINTEKILENFEKLTVLSRIAYAESEQPAADIPVLLVDENGVVLKKGFTDKDGMAMFLMPDDKKTYRVVIDKDLMTEEGDVQSQESFAFNNIYFDFNSDVVRPEAAKTLSELASLLNKQADKKIVIKAHTDALGTDDINKDLAQRRGENVRQFLVSKGVSTDRIEVVAIGDDQPIASNDLDMGRQLNRRVEFEIRN